MRPKSLILILIALGCGLIASIGISQVMEKNANGNAALKTSPIYVSAIDMAAGEELTTQKVKLEEWPVDKLPEGAVTSPEQLEGKSPTTRLYAGEPLLIAKLADRDRIRGTAVKIRKGYRVMSINVDAASAVAGLVSPGDHVDVMVFLRGSTGANKAEPVLQNIEVFAVNDVIQRDVDGEGRSIQARTVSLLVLPEQAEKLMLYTHTGVMSLSLRNPDEAVVETPPKSETSGIEALTALLPNLNPPAVPMALPVAEPEDTEPEFTMEIIAGGSGSVQRFNWDDRGELPRELSQTTSPDTPTGLPPTVSLDGLTVPTAAPSEETKSASTPASGAGSNPETPAPPTKGESENKSNPAPKAS